MKILFVLISLFPLSLLAQINKSDTLKFKGNISLTGAWQEGNAEVLILRGKAEFSYRPIDALAFKTQNAYLYQEFFKRKADEDVFSRNFIYFKPENKIYPFLLGFVSSNFRREVDLRYFVGFGATWRIIQKSKHWLKLAFSTEYEESDFATDTFNKSEYNGSQFITTWRATAWLSGEHHLLNNKVIFNHETYFQPSLEQSDNYRWQVDLGLEFPIWKFLNFKTNYLQTFENVVVEGEKQEDRRITFGLKIKL